MRVLDTSPAGIVRTARRVAVAAGLAQLLPTLGNVGSERQRPLWAGPLAGVRLFAVDQLLQLLAGLEKRDRLGRNLDRLARLGIASDAAAALACTEAAKASDLHLAVFPKGLDDGSVVPEAAKLKGR